MVDTLARSLAISKGENVNLQMVVHGKQLSFAKFSALEVAKMVEVAGGADAVGIVAH